MLFRELIDLADTRPMHPGTEDISVHLWLDSQYNDKWCTLMVVGDAGVDFEELPDQCNEAAWWYLGNLHRN